MADPSSLQLLGGFVAGLVVQMLVGGLWYSPLLFGNQFLLLQFGSLKPKFKKDPAQSMKWVWVTSSCNTLAVQALWHMAGCSDLASTAVLAVLLSGVAVALEFETYLFSNNEFELALLHAGHRVVATFLVLGVTLLMAAAY